MDAVRVATNYGSVAGVRGNGYVRFHAVPYAEAPFGELRLRAPAAPRPWRDVRDCTRAGHGAPQPWRRADPWDRLVNPTVQGEDCLTLDIWAPTPDLAPHPVMVWIHGGGFITGTGSAPVFRGASFARDGIVHVSVNYRLGIDGWCAFDDAPDNLGLRDQIAALRWVQENISVFGGDTGRVTVAGQSAGAISVAYLLAAPAARGLFKRAICQSGILDASVSVDAARRVTVRTAAALGVPPTADAFADVELNRLREVTTQMLTESVQMSNWVVFRPSLPFLGVHGTETLPRPVLDALSGGAGADVATLAGTNRDDAFGVVRDAGLLDVDPPEEWIEQGLALLGIGQDVLTVYRAGPRRITRTAELVTAALTDQNFRMPTIQLLEAHQGKGFLYQFDWESPALPAGMGADHGIEVPFVYDDLAGFGSYAPIGAEILGPEPPPSLAASMHGAWVGFVTDGVPGWPAYDLDRRITMRFAAVSAAVDDLAGDERKAWQRHGRPDDDRV
ncbi:carboxylesterase/lipase family protein [Virgisporangium aurantiacum]|uniref:Carboxylic ester hydrolase n=1 Tax=Virgisporangium aurantiacum TaxID=175570 RepID=A0A8J3ZKZ1_9ACTN|nr:carboxylesterase family protein [Virgisporangium aurantiacum]GIJ64713.1 carboxylic ester hydrolase [Virgisporangium aurantiacum]